MHIRVGYEIALELDQPTPLYTLMGVHPDRAADIRVLNPQSCMPKVEKHSFIDMFGNRCTRLVAPAGEFSMRFDAIVEDSGLPDEADPTAEQLLPHELPDECLIYLLGSRYCETDKLSSLAWKLFGGIQGGWQRVEAICDYVHRRLTFSYGFARATRTAAEAHDERVGVCRDFAHLAVALCRCLNIPARYVNGYMGDIGIEPDPAPMDFNAWFEVYLGGRWYTFDARHNERRIGRIVVARGRDATDVPLLQTFGPHRLTRFEVWTEETTVPIGATPLLTRRMRETIRASRFGPPGRSPHDLGVSADARSLL
jgi:transglutaminase-like putative cysteine protease